MIEWTERKEKGEEIEKVRGRETCLNAGSRARYSEDALFVEAVLEQVVYELDLDSTSGQGNYCISEKR